MSTRICKKLFLVFSLLLLGSGLVQAQEEAKKTTGEGVKYTGVWGKSTPSASSSNFSTSKHYEIRSLREAVPPQFITNFEPDSAQAPTTILFTFDARNLGAGPNAGATSLTRNAPKNNSPQTVKNVSIAFAFEGWRELHPYTRVVNETSSGEKVTIYFIYVDLDRDTVNRIKSEFGGQLDYRLVVDGIWMGDPVNPSSVKKYNGSQVSFVNLDQGPELPLLSPEIQPSKSGPRTVVLRCLAPADSTVTVVSTFNQFDPYLNPLKIEGENSRHPGQEVWSIELRLLPGAYVYKFLIDGNSSLDELNPRHAMGREGSTYSLLVVE